MMINALSAKHYIHRSYTNVPTDLTQF